jgi:hypothetical protein
MDFNAISTGENVMYEVNAIMEIPGQSEPVRVAR